MINRIRQFIFSFCIAGFVFAALSFEMSHTSHLPPPSGYVLSQDNENQVYIEAKALTPDESRDYVHRDLLSRGYQPILLQIDNTSPYSYELKRGQIDIETASAKEVASEIGMSSLPRTIAYKILGFLFWPLGIPGTIDSFRTWNKQYILKRDLEAKTLKTEGETIPPYSSVSRVLYVPNNQVKEVVQISMTNLDQKKIEDFFFLIPSLPAT